AFLIFLIIFGVLFTHYAYFPVLMANDSSTQFHQAKTFLFDDWHPPILPLIWFLTDKIIPGPEGFFLLQIALFWGTFLLVGIVIIRNNDTNVGGCLKYIALCLLPFSPFLLNIV